MSERSHSPASESTRAARRRQTNRTKYPRQRALRACHLCRARKTKCDNGQPTCGSCTTLRSQCSYDDTQRDHSTFDLATLEILRKLEEVIETQNELLGLVRSVDSAHGLRFGSPSGSATFTSRNAFGTGTADANPPTSAHLTAPALSFSGPYPGLERSSSVPFSPITSRIQMTTPKNAPHQLRDPSEEQSHLHGAAQSPAGSPAAVHWFGLLARDAARCVVPTTESDGDVDRTFLDHIDIHDHQKATPLQRATMIVDGQEPRESYLQGPLEIDQNGYDQATSEEQLWRAAEDLHLLPQEHSIFEHFFQRVSHLTIYSLILMQARQTDLFDPRRTFSTIVPHLALRNAGLMNAILALSCGHLSRCSSPETDERPDRKSALQYYYQTLHYVQKAMQYSSYQASHELLATSFIVSTYEMICGSPQDWGRHLHGVYWILRSNQINVETDGLASAVWWAWLRQDIWAAYREKRKTLTTWTPCKPYDALTPHEIALRSTWIMAQVVNFCSLEQHVESDSTMLERRNIGMQLKAILDDWHNHLTVEFSPLPVMHRHASELYQPLLIHPPCFGLALQLYYTAQILLSINMPFAGGNKLHRERMSAVQSAIQMVCRLGMTLTDEASSVLSSQCLFIAGTFVQDRRQQAIIAELIGACRSRTGWPASPLEDELRQIWSEP